MEIVKTGNREVAKSQVTSSTRHLLNDIHSGNKISISANVALYITRGIVNFEKILAISLHSRIPNLTHVYGVEMIHKILAALLTSFQNDLNLIRPMSAEQIESCSFDLVMTTEEDQLGVEDYVLFFKGAREGKYGKILDRLDQQTIFSLLEEYRQQRHLEFVKIKETKHLELKGLGPSDRSVQTDELAVSFNNIVGRLAEMRERLKEQREINMANRL